jgi:hypothetical protein
MDKVRVGVPRSFAFCEKGRVLAASQSSHPSDPKSKSFRLPGIDTGSMRTCDVQMNVTLSIDEQIVARARKKADALGKSLNQLIRDYLQKLAGGDDPERSIEEFKKLSGRGHSRGWRFNRNEIHERP